MSERIRERELWLQEQHRPGGAARRRRRRRLRRCCIAGGGAVDPERREIPTKREAVEAAQSRGESPPDPPPV